MNTEHFRFATMLLLLKGRITGKYYSLVSLWAFLFLVFIPNFCYSQQTPTFRAIVSKEGLLGSNVLSFLQDHQGFIWVGTDKGLSRYDGYRFILFNEDPEVSGSLKGSYVWSIYEDQEHNLWVGTDWLNFLNRETGKFEQIEIKKDTLSERNRDVEVITGDLQGNIWVGTSGSGLKCLTRIDSSFVEKTNWQVQHFGHELDNPYSISSNHIVDLLVDEEGFLWIATSVGLDRLHIQSGQVERFHAEPFTNWSSGTSLSSGLLKDQNGSLLFYTRTEGVFRLQNPQSTPLAGNFITLLRDIENPASISRKWIRAISRTDQDDLWLGTNQGLYRFNPPTGSISSFQYEPRKGENLALNRVRSLLMDKHHNLWIGTDGGGINFLEPHSDIFEHYKHDANDAGSLSSNRVRSMLMDKDGFLWVATFDGGLNKMRFEPKKGWIKVQNWKNKPGDPNSLPSNDVIKIAYGKSGKIWIGTYPEGLLQLDVTTGQMKRFGAQTGDFFDYRQIWTLHEDRKGSLWIGTIRAGLYRLDPNTGIIKDFSTKIGDPGNDYAIIPYLYEDHQGRLWVCTDNGIVQYDPESERTKVFSHDPNNPHSISDDMVWVVMEDSNHNLWMGTSVGLNLLDPNTNQFKRFYKRDGLPSNRVISLVEDDLGYLWIGTDAGLSRCALTSSSSDVKHPKKIFRNYNKEDGLFGDVFTYHACYKNPSTGQLFFGGIHGLNVVNPVHISIDTSQTTMLLSTFSKSNPHKNFGEAVNDPFIGNKEKITLSYQDDILNFTFTDNHFRQSGKNSFEYQLLGLNDQWIPMEEHKTMTFIDLDPGSYSLMIRGKTPDGLSIEEKRLMEIRIRPPWWLTPWAYALYIFSLVGLVFLLYRFQLRRQLEKQDHRRLKELDRFKSKFYTDVTHEFRTPLTVVLGLVEYLRSAKPSIPLAKVQRELMLINRNGERLVQLINQLLDLSKIENKQLRTNYIQGDIVPYIHFISESFQSLANSQNIILKVESKQVEILMDYDPEKFRQILANLLSNAIKYTNSGGKVRIGVNLEDIKKQTYLQLSVRDNGYGVPEKDLPRIFDRFYQADNPNAQSSGTGIGLALTKELIKLLGGTIKVESELGKGTTFIALLPIRSIQNKQHLEVSG